MDDAHVKLLVLIQMAFDADITGALAYVCYILLHRSSELMHILCTRMTRSLMSKITESLEAG